MRSLRRYCVGDISRDYGIKGKREALNLILKGTAIYTSALPTRADTPSFAWFICLLEIMDQETLNEGMQCQQSPQLYRAYSRVRV